MSTATIERSRTAHHGATAGAVVGRQLFVLGGSRSAYDHRGDVRTVGLDGTGVTDGVFASVPTVRGNLVAEAIGSQIVTIGGLVASKEGAADLNTPCDAVEVLDTTSGAWRRAAPLPQARVKPGVATCGGMVYALSGRSGDTDARTVYGYDVELDRWFDVAELPYGARHGAACRFGDRVYFAGGGSISPGSKVVRSSMLRFEPATNQVVALRDMPGARTGHSMVALGDSIYVLGGMDPEKRPCTSVLRYDVARDSWSVAGELGSPRVVFACGVVNDVVLLAGGWRRMLKESNETVEEFAPRSG
ncbi:MAG: kelch repeat-containing protein [Planctomycetota bacterium]